jgi:hypothetical protein
MKIYWFSFGITDPRTYSGLSPTFIQFFDQSGATLAPPAITEPFTGSGEYKFTYYCGYSTSIAFLIDGDTTGSTLTSANLRYIRGNLDPNDTLSLVVGNTASSFGTTASPSTVMGYAKRSREWLEGAQQFLKSSGQWSIYDRGASTLLGIKILTNDTTGVTAIP